MSAVRELVRISVHLLRDFPRLLTDWLNERTRTAHRPWDYGPPHNDGGPTATCRADGREWPCPEWVRADTALTESRIRTTVSVLDLRGKPDDPLYVGPVA